MSKYLCVKYLTWVATQKTTQLNSYSISHLIDTVTTWWLDSDSEVTLANCWQHSDWVANGSVVTVLPVVNNSDYTVTDQSLCSHSAA